MRIEVTQDDIDSGKRCDGEDCPIARAIRRETKAKAIHVEADKIAIDGKKYETPMRAAIFIDEFDHSLDEDGFGQLDDGDPEDYAIPEPFTFELEEE